MKIACVQSGVVFNDPGANAKVAVEKLEELAGRGIDLAVFPEAFLTGYCVDSFSDAQRIAIGPRDLIPIQAACDRLGILCIVGFAERQGDDVYNAAALIEPNREIRIYHKTHLP